MDFDQIQKLMDKLESSKLSKLSIKKGAFELTLEKESAARLELPSSFVPARAVEVPLSAEGHQKEKSSAHSSSPSGHIIKSPMVGTFYKSASPGDPSFVKLGDAVAKGKVICIIEAMKVMNEIQSEISGKISEILVEDGHSVEFGQPLFRIEHA